jgi:hypothetical protein
MKLKVLAKSTFWLLLFAFTVFLAWFPSCKEDPMEYKIDRANSFSFRLDTFDVVTTTDVLFYPGPPVLHVFNDSTEVLFQRISLQAHGFTPNSIEYWFIVDFDTKQDGDAVGTYRTEYDTVNGGIDEMRLILDNNGQYLVFRSFPGSTSVYFQVDAQRQEESIMRGVFGGILFFEGNPLYTQALISDGVFKDIKY